MIDLDQNANENKTEHNRKWSHISDPLYRILFGVTSGSGKQMCYLIY